MSPFKLTPFGDLIAGIERERLIEGLAAIKAGWTPETHVPEPKPDLTPKRTPTPDYAAMRLVNAKRRVAQLEAQVARLEPPAPSPLDHGELNIPIHKRNLDADITRRVTYNQALTDLAHARARVEYWEERATR